MSPTERRAIRKVEGCVPGVATMYQWENYVKHIYREDGAEAREKQKEAMYIKTHVAHSILFSTETQQRERERKRKRDTIKGWKTSQRSLHWFSLRGIQGWNWREMANTRGTPPPPSQPTHSVMLWKILPPELLDNRDKSTQRPVFFKFICFCYFMNYIFHELSWNVW